MAQKKSPQKSRTATKSGMGAAKPAAKSTPKGTGAAKPAKR